ncbi:hypothetical protein EDD37DRAFT_99429 [Exophiala viscosa]|uniref:uncharacterized protein n=1 Tax=Exophiala viscosa TaxID=2486360 RepID=UPI0021995116|nr:hypothetical protein EDD37DRAFT_99429 [Exophiala viscosa]
MHSVQQQLLHIVVATSSLVYARPWPDYIWVAKKDSVATRSSRLKSLLRPHSRALPASILHRVSTSAAGPKEKLAQSDSSLVSAMATIKLTAASVSASCVVGFGQLLVSVTIRHTPFYRQKASDGMFRGRGLALFFAISEEVVHAHRRPTAANFCWWFKPKSQG